MDEITFQVRRESLGGRLPEPAVTPVINGASLVELARAVEEEPAAAEGRPGLAGAYAGLAVRGPEWTIDGQYLGSPMLTWFRDSAATVVLGCTCGEWGCWLLTAEVVVGPTAVTWQRFRNGRRHAWDLSALGPFTFDRRRYEHALREAAAATA